MRRVAKRSVLPLLLLACQSSPDSELDPLAQRRRLWDAELARLESRLAHLPSDLEKTTFLREYTGALIDIGPLDRPTKELFGHLDLAAFDPADFYHLFKHDSVPAECGITSYFYIKLLRHFGFEAFQYSFGFTAAPWERFIHSLALVEIEFEGKRLTIVQDPYLNLTYRDRSGAPIDFLELLSAIRARRYEAIERDSTTVTTSLVVADPALYYPYLGEACRQRLAEALRQEDGTLATTLPIARNYETLMQSPCDDFEAGFENALRQNGFDEPFLYAMTLRASEVVGAGDHQSLQRRIDAVVRGAGG